jgi:glycosyltransferase involved in cell wall biosynthesis
MELRIENSVVVITPTVGKEQLKHAIESVSQQTYKNITHLIVVDGTEYFQDVLKVTPIKQNVIITTAPYNTGGNGYYGHRIYAAYSHLVNHDYVAFLDEDNWFEPNHIETLVKTLETKDYDWVHSLRKVYVENDYLADDCCESIGRYPIWFSQPDNPQHLVDTSSYLFKRDFLTRVASYWHYGWGGDRRFFTIITKGMNHDNYGTSGQHTLNYKLPDMNKAYGGDFKFFEKGNAAIKQQYGGKYPWTE